MDKRRKQRFIPPLIKRHNKCNFLHALILAVSHRRRLITEKMGPRGLYQEIEHVGHLVRVALYIGDEKFMELDAASNLRYLLHVRYMCSRVFSLSKT